MTKQQLKLQLDSLQSENQHQSKSQVGAIGREGEDLRRCGKEARSTVGGELYAEAALGERPDHKYVKKRR